MVAQPIDYFLLAWFVLAALSTAYVAWDQFKNNPEPVVMKWGFILVTLYMGPIGLLLYVMADKEPRPGEHEEFIKTLRKQGVGSTIHCVSGYATGIITAAEITAALGQPKRLDQKTSRRMPLGTFVAALTVSSDVCADASKPVTV